MADEYTPQASTTEDLCTFKASMDDLIRLLVVDVLHYQSLIFLHYHNTDSYLLYREELNFCVRHLVLTDGYLIIS